MTLEEYKNEIKELKERIEKWEIANVQAEWHHKMDGERIERFEPPIWEEIKDGYFFAFFQRLEDIIWEWQFEVIKGDCSNEGITFYNNTGDVKFQKPATKENYAEACEVVRDLFNKGDKE